MSRLLNMILRGVLRATAAASGPFRTATVSLPTDTPDDVQHFQIHGFESRPPAGSSCLVVAASGNADHLVALVAGASGLSLAAGESAAYNEHGWSIQLKEASIDFVKDGVIRMRIAEDEIVLGDPDNPAVLPIARLGDPTQTGGLILVTPAAPPLGPTLVRSE